jgi:hypothetical protein
VAARAFLGRVDSAWRRAGLFARSGVPVRSAERRFRVAEVRLRVLIAFRSVLGLLLRVCPGGLPPAPALAFAFDAVAIGNILLARLFRAALRVRRAWKLFPV